MDYKNKTEKKRAILKSAALTAKRLSFNRITKGHRNSVITDVDITATINSWWENILNHGCLRFIQIQPERWLDERWAGKWQPAGQLTEGNADTSLPDLLNVKKAQITKILYLDFVYCIWIFRIYSFLKQI